ncbi:MAG: hypothetical protein UHH95_04690 [Oscillospiraceae bacterium]|nr:hypothetical protein [Oscillospiraceae bacterium]
MAKKLNLPKFLYFTVLISFIFPTVFLIGKIIIISLSTIVDPRPISDYILMLLECILGIVVIHLPSFLERKFSFEIPKTLYIMYLIFLYCAITLGEVRDFYYKVPHWDSILHGFSSLMSGTFGFMVVDILNKDRHTTFTLSPLFVAIFAFCFGATIGTLWEIYEYSFDGMLGLNMQKFRLADGTELVGHAALSDTMKDIIIDSLGALIASVIGYFNLKIEKRRAAEKHSSI